MMDLTSTKRGLTRITRRFGGLRYVSTPKSFKGVLQPAFSDWIGNHWVFARLGWFRPVERDFAKQKSPYELLGWPRPHRVGEIKYTFSPTIQLSCFSGSSSKTFIEINGARVFQTLTPQLKNRDETRTVLLPASLGKTSAQMSEDRGLNWAKQLLAFPDRGRQNELSDRGKQGESAKLQGFLSSLFSTVFRNVAGITRSFMTILRDPPGAHEATNAHGSSPLPLMRPGLVNSPIIRRRSTHWLKATPMVQRLEQTFLMLTKGSETASERRFASSHFTTVALNFVAPKIDESEMANERIARFVSSPAFTYAKREQGLSEGIVHALRDLRGSQNENKTVAVPQLPSIEHLTNQVRTRLEREIRIERERRGL